MPTILVVDDSEVDRRITGSCIERGTHATVVYASDGADAIRQVAEHAPDLVITDLQMPGINGLQLLTSLKVDHPGAAGDPGDGEGKRVDCRRCASARCCQLRTQAKHRHGSTQYDLASFECSAR